MDEYNYGTKYEYKYLTFHLPQTDDALSVELTKAAGNGWKMQECKMTPETISCIYVRAVEAPIAKGGIYDRANPPQLETLDNE